MIDLEHPAPVAGVGPAPAASRRRGRGRLPWSAHVLLALTSLSLGNWLLVLAAVTYSVLLSSEPMTVGELAGAGLWWIPWVVVWVELPVAALLGLPLSLLLDRLLLRRTRRLALHLLAYAGVGLLPLVVVSPWFLGAGLEDGAAGLWEVLVAPDGVGGIVALAVLPFVASTAAARAVVSPLEQGRR